MNFVFTPSPEGIPIRVLLKDHYEEWYSAQTETTQNWIDSTHYARKGMSLIPNTDGTIQEVIYTVENENDYFSCADLPTLLPGGLYTFADSDIPARQLALAWAMGSYSFDRYKTKQKDKSDKLTLELASETLLAETRRFSEAIYLVRDLINTPAGDMMPENLGQQAEELAARFGGTVSQVVGQELLEQNYPAIHAVGRASAHAPRFIELNWGKEQNPKVTLVGKGVCFDSGGLNLKPGDSIRLMKKDMGGAAHVLGLASMIMSHDLPVHLRVLIAAAENAVSGNSFRPGDILDTRAGKRIEIDNTDAEGRLVLCDALTAATEDEPEIIIDFATLTGAARVALGTELPAFFCNDDDVARTLVKAGSKVDDPVWQLPLHAPYRYMLDSKVADMLNSAATGYAGAITAALYLQEFVNKDCPWIHFDVMAWNIRERAGRPVGGEAFAIRAVFEMLHAKYDKHRLL